MPTNKINCSGWEAIRAYQSNEDGIYEFSERRTTHEQFLSYRYEFSQIRPLKLFDRLLLDVTDKAKHVGEVFSGLFQDKRMHQNPKRSSESKLHMREKLKWKSTSPGRYFGEYKSDSNESSLENSNAAVNLKALKIISSLAALKRENTLQINPIFPNLEKAKVIAEIDDVNKEEVIISFDDDRIGWYTATLPRHQFDNEPEIGFRIPVDVWFSKHFGLVKFGIAVGSKPEKKSECTRATSKEQLPSQPEDFDDPLQMEKYMNEMQEFFHSK